MVGELRQRQDAAAPAGDRVDGRDGLREVRSVQPGRLRLRPAVQDEVAVARLPSTIFHRFPGQKLSKIVTAAGRGRSPRGARRRG